MAHTNAPEAGRDNRFRILIVDDEPAIRSLLATCLQTDTRDLCQAEDGLQALDFIKRSRVSLVFLDVNMPGPSGIDTLKRIKAIDRETTVIMLTGFANVATAIDAMKSGAEDFVVKPVMPDVLKALSVRIEQQTEARRIVASGEMDRQPPEQGPRILTRNPAMFRTMELIRRVAPLPSTVLVEGESGTGKELVARAIHASSPRAKKRFVAFNCAVIPEHLLESELFGHEQGAFTGAATRKIGYFEAAEGGTLFLDEIGEMGFDLQAKLLRVLQERTFRRVGGIEEVTADVRVIAATNRNLEKEADAGRFRKDLFYRINVVRVAVPPLRERPQDIPLLCEHFVRHFAQEFSKPVEGISLQVMERFLADRWDGNIRELQNTIEHAVAVSTGPQITLLDLPERFRSPGFLVREPGELKSFDSARLDFEQEYLKRAMEQTSGNIALASRLAGLSRQSLYEKLARHGIEQSRFRQGNSDWVA